jgi:hypothetical protein
MIQVQITRTTTHILVVLLTIMVMKIGLLATLCTQATAEAVGIRSDT